MKQWQFINLTLLAMLVVLGVNQAMADEDTPPLRVLSIGGAVTEIVYALEMEHRLIGRDTTSNFPPEVTELPDVGYMRALSPEGVLAIAPDLIIAVEGAGPPETIDVLNDAGIAFVTIPEGFDGAALRTKVEAVAQALGVTDRGAILADQIDGELQAASDIIGPDAPRVLFILSMQSGRVMASGSGTAADAIITMAGGQNAFTAFEGYLPVTDEAVLAAAPDVILMMDRMGDPAMEDSDLFAHPALSTTPAAQQGQVIRMNGLFLLGFGPRTPQAVTDLARAFAELGQS